MKITLQVSGREMTFSDEELSAILEKYFSVQKKETTSGKCFEVNLENIDRNLFTQEREDADQELVRLRILDALKLVKEYPERYAKSFKILTPKKEWSERTVEELERIAETLGDHLGDEVEKSLEIAQRIANGESWEHICNSPDTSDYFRLIKWRNGDYRIVGGSRKAECICSQSDFGREFCYAYDILCDTIPFVVTY